MWGIKRSLTLVLVLLLVAICAGSSSAAAKNKDFIYVSGTEATHLDPHRITDTNSGRILRQIHDSLFKRVENSVIVPNLAIEATEADHVTWKIKLREGVFFHCGEPFTSKAVKYTWERLLDPATASARRSSLPNIKSIECSGDYEVVVNLTKRSMMFPGIMAIDSNAVICPVCGPKYGLKDYSMHPCGTGALKFDHWNPGIELVMVRNGKWWGGEPKVDRVTFKVLNEDATRVMMVRTGDADVVAGVPAVLVSNLEAAPDVALTTVPGYRTIHIGCNQTKELFSDVRVRQALNYAIDKRAIINNLFKGMAEYPSGFVSTSIEYANPNINMYEYNPGKAKELLAEAGYPNGFSCQLMTPEGRYPMDRQVSEVIQAMLAAVGIKADIQVRDWGAFQEQLTTFKTELYFLGLGNAAGDAEYSFVQFFAPGAGQNYSGINDPAINQIMGNISNSRDMEERKQSLYKIQEIFMENAHVLPLYYEHQIFATRADIKGFRLFPNEQLELWDLERK